MTGENLPPDFVALLSLLDDPDSEAFEHVKDRISSLGPIAVPSLEQAWEQSFDPVIQKRIEELVHQIQLNQLYLDFTGWISGGAKDLFYGYLLVSRFQYPDLQEMKVRAQFDKIVRDIWLELNDNLTSLEKIKVLNHILFLIQKFSGNMIGPATPEQYFLNLLLESRQGTSLSLGIIYLIAAQRLGIPVSGVDFPGHFILAYTNQVTDASIAGMDALEVQFYINPFARGAVFNRKELNEYLTKVSMKPEAHFFVPCSNRKVIFRLIRELQEAYRAAGRIDKAEELDRFREAAEEENI